jgi:hypothetical protein
LNSSSFFCTWVQLRLERERERERESERETERARESVSLLSFAPHQLLESS